MRNLTLTAILIIISSIIMACGGVANAEPAPPAIHYGEDMCEFCGMIISEERFAAGYLTQDGQEHIFDDIGDMVQAYLQNQAEVTAIFVHDYDDHTWLRAEKAYYVASEQLPTPMLSGLAAFASGERAAAFAQETAGRVLTYDELVARYQ